MPNFRRPSAILDLFYSCLDHHRRLFGGLCDCTKFGCNRLSTIFGTMHVLIFCALSLKMHIHAPKNSFFLGFDLEMCMGMGIPMAMGIP